MGIESYGLSVGSLPHGQRNSIADVADVKVGRSTIEDPGRGLHTGVTVVVPCEGPVFSTRPVAAAHSLNGFGKTCGTVQVAELGYLETPIALTGTMNVGRVADALVENALREEERAGHALPQSVNPVVGETNDGRISRIQARPVGTKEVLAAIDGASKDFAHGAVGAGRGTVCFGLKGGIGSSSRIVDEGGRSWTVGVLVQTNFGRMPDLMVCGRHMGPQILARIKGETDADAPEKGSVMVVVATDAPLSSRQLGRVIRRATVGLVRCGSYMGHGSGDIFLGFTTGLSMGAEDGKLPARERVPEESLDAFFRACAEATEEAVLDSLVSAEAATGLDGTVYHSLTEFL